MIDFYEELLKLSPIASLDNINKKLTQLEKDWTQRQINNPEIATKKLAEIIDARAAFKNEASRAEYDRSLNDSKRVPVIVDPDTDRKQQFDKWYTEAYQFRSSQQNDLAKTAIENAMSFTNPNSIDPEFYSLAAEIYRENNDYTTALAYINKSIVASPNAAMYYINKALIIQRQALAAKNRANLTDAADFFSRERETYQTAISKAENSGDNYSKAVALGVLAYSWYYFLNPDALRAESYAMQAVELSDAWGNGKRVLDDINEKRTAAEIAAQVHRRNTLEEQERAYREAQKYAEYSAKKKKRDGIRKSVFLLGCALLAICTYMSLANVYYIGNFDAWISKKGVLLVPAILVFFITFAINLDNGFAFGKNKLIGIMIAYGIIYSIAWVVITKDVGGILALPFLLFGLYVVCGLISFIIWKIDKTIETHNRLL